MYPSIKAILVANGLSLKLIWLMIRNAFNLGFFLFLGSLGDEVLIVVIVLTSLPALVVANMLSDEVIGKAKQVFYVHLTLIGISFIMLLFFNEAYLKLHPEFCIISSLFLIVKPPIVFAYSRVSQLTARMLMAAFK